MSEPACIRRTTTILSAWSSVSVSADRDPRSGCESRSGCSGSAVAVSCVPYDGPVRAAFIGLGRIYDLNVRGYLDNRDVEVVALVDPSQERRAQRQADWPGARTFAPAAELAATGIEVDAAEVLPPVPLHPDRVAHVLRFRSPLHHPPPIRH